jgi:outer membrane biogenesis lipoprotein LolB
MKILIIAILLLAGCSATLSKEQARQIDHNFTVLSSTLRGMDERVKKLEEKESSQGARPARVK